MRGPGIPEGRVVDDLVLSIDLAPTLARWAGIEVPERVDGRALQPLLARETGSPVS
ncbi:MAG: sulfatase/phosphatase domain-containing protein [Myxococcota bacterium]